MTKQVLKDKWQKNYLKKACKTKDTKDWIIYKEARNRYNRLIKSTIRDYYTKELRQNKGNMKGTWNSINSLINKQSKSVNITYFQGDNNKEIEKGGIPNAFNKHQGPAENAYNSHKLKCFKTHVIVTFHCVSQYHQSVENFYDKLYILHANEISYKITNDVRANYRLKLQAV